VLGQTGEIGFPVAWQVYTIAAIDLQDSNSHLEIISFKKPGKILYWIKFIIKAYVVSIFFVQCVTAVSYFFHSSLNIHRHEAYRIMRGKGK